MTDLLKLIGIIMGVALVGCVVYVIFSCAIDFYRKKYNYNLWPGVVVQFVQIVAFYAALEQTGNMRVLLIALSLMLLLITLAFNIHATTVRAGLGALMIQFILGFGVLVVICLLLAALGGREERKKGKEPDANRTKDLLFTVLLMDWFKKTK